MQYSVGSGWGALRLCWKGFKVAKAQNDIDDMKKYAKRIRWIQKELHIKISDFPNLGLTGTTVLGRPE